MLNKSDCVRGVRVICDNDQFDLSLTPSGMDQCSLPVKGRIYTIREICESNNSWGVRLMEIQNPVLHYTRGGNHEPVFSLSRFSILEEKPKSETDILTNQYTYNITWSEEDAEFVATCAEFPSLSYLASGRIIALNGIIRLVRDVVIDMQKTGEIPPIKKLFIPNIG